ncbi:MAG: TonB-dependent receptor, partial [Acidobacteria bacterium]|nr:TonB-dependent receptor [Acidobacteriota bacterium]
TTADPSFTSSGWFTAGVGSFNELFGSLYGTTGLSEKVAVDWSLYYRDSDSYHDDVNTGKPTAPIHQKVARAKVLFLPSDSSKLVLTLEYSDLNDPGGLTEVTRDPIAQFYHDVFGVPIVTTLESDKTSLNYQPRSNPVTSTASLKGVFQIGDVTLKSLTQYRDQEADIRADLDGTSILYWNAEYEELEKTFTQEFNFSGSGERLNWTAGVYYLDDTGSLTNNAWQDFFNSGTRTQWLYSEAEVSTESVGVYADGALRFGDRFWLTLGGRYTSEEKRLKSQGLLPPFTAYDDATRWEEFTPRAVLRFAPTEGSSLYASFAQGFMSGNYTYTTVGPQEAVDPERITQYELGYKATGSGWSFDTAAYFSDYKDLQVFLFDDACVCFHLDNAPKAETYGWEGQLWKRLAPDFSLNLSLAYTHARYKEYVGIGLTGGPYIAPNYGLATAPTDFSGRQMVRTPEWTGSVGFSYNPEVSFGRINLSGNYYYTSEIPLSPGGELVQDAYGLASLRLGWTSSSGSYSVSLIAQNLFDETYLVFSGGGFLGNNHIYGPPASYGLRFEFRY